MEKKEPQIPKLNPLAKPFLPAFLAKHAPPPPLSVMVLGPRGSGKTTMLGKILKSMDAVETRMEERCKRMASEDGDGAADWLIYFLKYCYTGFDDEDDDSTTIVPTSEPGSGRLYVFHDVMRHYHRNTLITNVGLLIVSAPDLEKDMETIRDILLVSSFRFERLIIAINKMDLCGWSSAVFSKLRDNLQSCTSQYVGKVSSITYVPICAKTGNNIASAKSGDGEPQIVENAESLLGALGKSLPASSASPGPLCVLVLDCYESRYVHGQVLSGTIHDNEEVRIVPQNVETRVVRLRHFDGEDMIQASAGANIVFELSHPVEPELRLPGGIICLTEHLFPRVKEFVAEFQIMHLPKFRPILTGGFAAVLHVHSTIEDCVVDELLDVKGKGKKPVARAGDTVKCRIVCKNWLCVAPENRVLGTFVLRDADVTIGIGKVIDCVKSE